jgi:large subunit ribosomal protein L7/L12
MAKLSTDELLESFKEMTLLELNEFVQKFEAEFDVSAAAPTVAAAPAPAAAAEGEAEEEAQDQFDVVLSSTGEKKIEVIKEVRGLTNLGLKEAKEMVEELPKPILEGVSRDTADQAKESVEAAGGTVELK